MLLRVPTPTKQSLSFCDASARGLKRWLEELPRANVGESARQLYQALIELNQLRTPLENRLQLLELLRPEVHLVCKQLERHFLNQAIVLDERPRKVANLCQALQNHLAVGYKLIVARLVTQPARERNTLLGAALQRASHSLCAPLVRANQLYCPVPDGLWLELHQLYQLARARNLHQQQVRDPLARHAPGLSVEQCYLVALLLGCARCNQMRQSSIASLAEALEPWSALVRLQAADLPSSLFAVLPQQDAPPRYCSLLLPGERQSALGINPRALVEALDRHLAQNADKLAEPALFLPEGFSQDLLQHLRAAWGDIAERSFQRVQGQGALTLCVGMSAVHFFLAGQRPFSQVLELPSASRAAVFKPTGSDDVWTKSFDASKKTDWNPGLGFEEIEYSKPAGAETGQADSGAADSYPTYVLPLVNHSPGGYCLSWPKEVPSQLQAGELLGIQASPAQGWSLAVVRWIRQVRGGGTQMGIELISPHAQACGLQLVRKAEQSSQYLRALLLPAISAISRPATLITPRLPFQEGNKVTININGQEKRAHLTRRQTSSPSFSQFEYTSVDRPPTEQGKPVTSPNSGVSGGEEDFDSLWKSL